MSPEPEVQVNYSEPANGSTSMVPVNRADGLTDAQEHPLDDAGDVKAKVNVNQMCKGATAAVVGISEILAPRKRERRNQSPFALTLLETTGAMSPASSSASQANSGDATFEPTIEMMVNDFDDEGTLNEEESLAAMECQDPHDEIATLQEESEMPLDELLAKYSSMPPLLPPPRKKPKKPISGPPNKRKKSKKQDIQQSAQEKCVQSEGSHLAGTSEQTSQQQISNVVKFDAQPDVIVIESGDEENTSVDRKIIDMDVIEVGDGDGVDDADAEGIDDDEDGNAEDDEVEKIDGDVDLQYTTSNLPVNNVIQKDAANCSGQSGEFVRKRRSHLLDLYPEETFTSVSQNDGKVIPLEILYDEEEDDEDDEDDELDDGETESDYVKKTIMVGSAYQAVIPVGLSQYGDVLPYENEDKLIWEPSQVSEREVEEYLQKARDIKSTLSDDEEQSEASCVKPATTKEPNSGEAADTNVEDSAANSKVFLFNNAPTSMANSEVEPAGVVKDNEQALHLLVQCGYDFKEALRRKRLNAVPMTGSMSIWSEDECHKFEEGIQKFGKDFLKIRQNQVRTRSMRELVQFYYQWKKSERRDHDFANSNTVDHMDIYLNEGGDYGPNPNVPAGAPTSANSTVLGVRKIPVCLQKNFSIMTGGSSGGGLAAASNNVSSPATPQGHSSNDSKHSRKRSSGGGGGGGAGLNNMSSNESSQTPCPAANCSK